MTLALCLNCGRTKFGALCPCTECGAGSTGNAGLDIAFSDHLMHARSIEAFGRVVRAIRAATDDPDVAAWAFIAYVSRDHPTVLTAEPPPDVAPAVAELLGRVVLPPVELVPVRRPGRDAGPSFSVTLPPDLLRAFETAHGFDQLALVELLLRDGSKRTACVLPAAGGGGHTASGPGPADLQPDDVVGIRPARGCLPVLGRRPWVRRPSPGGPN
ncbi:MAG TPA: hypothetical protein VF796_22345 [Humisphaera sp.]